MCIHCGYYLKNFDHSRDLSDNLRNTVLVTNQEFANFFINRFLENKVTVQRKFNLSENVINPNNEINKSKMHPKQPPINAKIMEVTPSSNPYFNCGK